jgi:amino acid permease
VTTVIEHDAASVQHPELPADGVEEEFHRGLKERHIQMIAIGGAIGSKPDCPLAHP